MNCDGYLNLKVSKMETTEIVNDVDSIEICKFSLNEENKMQVRDFLNQRLSVFKAYINKSSFLDMSEILMNLYNKIINKDGYNVITTVGIVGDPNQQTTKLEVTLAGCKKQAKHIRIFSNYGGMPSYVPENILSVNPIMIPSFLESIQSTPVIKKSVTEFVNEVLKIFPDYITYYYSTASDNGLIGENLCFVNTLLNHGILVSICPLIVAEKYVNEEISDVHCLENSFMH